MRLPYDVTRILDSALVAYRQDIDRDFVTEKDRGYRAADYYNDNPSYILPMLNELIEGKLMEASPNPYENRLEYRITVYGQEQLYENLP